MTTTTYTYDDSLRAGSRRPRLYLIDAQGRAIKFEGQPIDGICVIAGEKYTRNGKWSGTVYQLLLAPGVKTWEMLSPLHGIYGQDAQSWQDLANKAGVQVSVAKAVIGVEYPKTAERLDQVEAFLAASKPTARRYYLNSAVITAPGTYSYRLVSQDEARAWDSEGDPPISTIGYGTTAELLGDILGHEVAVDRTPCTMQPGDEALVLRFRLDFRLPANWKTGTEGRREAERMFTEGKFELGILTRIE